MIADYKNGKYNTFNYASFARFTPLNAHMETPAVSMQYGLGPHTIKSISELFARYPEVGKAILYGSRAMGNYRNGSDIDLCLIGDALDLSLLFSIENALDDLLLPYKIDLSLWNKIENPDLLDHIRRVGRVFYEKASAEQ